MQVALLDWSELPGMPRDQSLIMAGRAGTLLPLTAPGPRASRDRKRRAQSRAERSATRPKHHHLSSSPVCLALPKGLLNGSALPKDFPYLPARIQAWPRLPISQGAAQEEAALSIWGPQPHLPGKVLLPACRHLRWCGITTLPASPSEDNWADGELELWGV